MKAAAYIRVSTDEQALEGFSLTAQLSELQKYCQNNNITIHEVYQDEGISGQKEDRPRFQAMLRDAEKGLFNVILVHKFDRFARSVEISQKIKNRLKKANVNVISITEPIEDSPIGFFQEGLLELLSEYFIRNLSKEVKKGLVQRASEGHHVGMMPYGYFCKGGEVFVNEEQAKVIREIYDLYLQGWGYHKIAKHLNYSEIKTMTGGEWSYFQVDRILSNVKYAGWIYYAGKTYDSKFPSIISRDVFVEAQNQRGEKGPRYTYRSKLKDKYLLHGFLKCGECGSSMRLVKYTPNSHGYSCNTAQYRLGRCSHTKSYNGRKMDDRILEAIEEAVNNRKYELNIGRKVEVETFVDNRKVKITQELQRAKDAYLGGVFDLDEYKTLKTKLEAELNQQDTLKKSEVVCQDDIKGKLKILLEELHGIHPEDIPGRKTILHKIIRKVVIHKDRIEIVYLG